MNELKVMNIEGIECYEKNGTAYLKRCGRNPISFK